ncbi:hypothetical protein [Sphingomonas sp. CFBP 13733]|uniref:hypothetical protein n=1 Tax=Sphingomonas sp. CFBP 13733 TaxID=2775291 RepID=UPI00177E46D2|nr:hypothetical protein [Sphingomonas sp. CFBP 13733]MBD8640249.1 hypothetical protein [Sphingomonas sp. CFBP 13733]
MTDLVRQIAGHRSIARGSKARETILSRIQDLARSENVAGFGIGVKRSGHVRTDVPAIVFFVQRKQPLSALGALDAIPEVLPDAYGRAVYTDVVQVGRFTAHAHVTRSPLRSGYSVGHRAGAPGTVGAVVTKGGAPHLLSAQHVLADFDRGSEGDDIVYPAIADGGRSGDRCGTLVRYRKVVLGREYPNRVDAALCRLSQAAVAKLDLSIPGAAAPIATGTAREGMPVRLFGRTSGSTRAHVSTLASNADLWWDPYGEYVGFSEQIICDGLSASGDSGALVLDADTGRAIGLLIGGSGDASVVTPIGVVLNALGVAFAN